MRSRLMLIPMAAVAAAVPGPALAQSQSVDFMTVEQAQKLLFPGATFTQDFISLNDQQFAAIREASGVQQWVREIQAWKVSTGGWFLVDLVVGRDDVIHYGVGLSADGTVTGIEIITCLGHYTQITNAAWRKRFVGLRRGQASEERIPTISGASLSSSHMREGIERVLVTYDMFLKQRK